MSPCSRAARFGAVLATMMAAHNVGDHIVQTDRQAAGKTTDWRAMAGHVGGYHLTMAGMLLAADRLLGLHLPHWRLAAALAVSAGTHALLDRRWPVRWLLIRTRSPGFADPSIPGQFIEHLSGGDYARAQQVPLHGPYLADQALHHTALWTAALIAAGGDPRCLNP